MNLKKTVAIAAAAGALAAISVPAMALENEFHGSFGFNTTFSNFQNGGSGDVNPAGRGVAAKGFGTQNTITGIFAPGTSEVPAYGDKRKMNNYFEQRARLQYIAKASDDLKLVTHFEIDHRFGDGNADLDTDSVNLEVKHVYLDFNLGKSFNTKTGLQAYTDTIKGLFITADVPAIMTTTKLGAYTLGLGFSRFDDDSAGGLNRLGDKNKDLFIMDNKFAFSKDTQAALSYYFLADYAAGTTGYANSAAPTVLELGNADAAILLHTFALSGATKVGALNLSGFAAMQAGHQKNAASTVANERRSFHGWAANVAAKMAVGPGTARTALLFTSGDNSTNAGHYKGWVTSSVNAYNEGGMMIIARNTANSPGSTDNYIRRNVTNIALATMGYDAKLSDKLYLNGNVGFGWVPASQAYAGSVLNPNRNGSDFMGTEINLETGYKVYQNLTLRAQAAYMILGGYYDKATLNSAGTAATPEDPYTMRLHATYAF